MSNCLLSKNFNAKTQLRKWQVTMIRTQTYVIGLLILLSGCYNFDKEVAVKEFTELKPNCEIIKMKDYECDGSLGECWYVEFKYKYTDSGTVYDTTLQYWRVDGKWIIKKEHIKN